MKLTEQDARSRSTPVQENMQVQQRLWTVERLGLWWMLAMVLLTLLGLFSKGLLSSSHVRAEQGQLAVHYERFLRNGASALVVIDLHGQPGAELPVRIEGEWLDGLTVESITPPVAHAATFSGTGLQLQVRADASGQARVHLAVRADGVGLYHSVIEGGGGRLTFDQFLYP